MARLSDLFGNPEATKRGQLAELLYQRSLAQPEPQPDIRTAPPQVLGSLLAGIDSAKRRVGRNMRDLIDNPNQYLGLIAGRLPDTAMKMASDPGNFIPGGGLAGTFIGKNAKTWNAVKEAEALKRLAAGEDPRAVWRETQVGIAPWDTALRSEIADNASLYRGAKASGSSYADDVLVHPELFNNYQGMKSARVNEFDGVGGSINDAASQIRVGTKADANGTMLHELQHGIQQNEGWSRGGSPDVFAKESQLAEERITGFNRTLTNISRLMDEAKQSGDKEKLASLKRLYDETMVQKTAHVETALRDPFNTYQRLAGEAEARLTEARIPMTMEERLNQYPYDPAYFEKATGVRLGDLITRFK